ncbi:MAG TPA: hypothetical protein VHQ94_06165 [Pyrinomonadaceae bacterium]|jgi:hypothetical protein|nr:hypothetical protein [Pyrinomonadaceae bacterium]
MRRFVGNMNGEQYLANANPAQRVVHDLDPEMVECRIDEIINAGTAEPFRSEADARAAGFGNCEHCIEPLHVVRQRQRLAGGGH